MTTLQVIGLGLFTLLLLTIAKNIHWHDFMASKKKQHMLFGSAAAMFFLWIFRAGIYDGLSVHFLWIVALTLILGFRFAIIAATIALLGVTAIGKESWHMIGVNGLLGIAAPIGLSYLIFMLTFHKLPRHIFIYIFLCAFIPGALAIAFKMALLGSYYALDGIHSWTVVTDNFLVLIPLLLFPEGMLNGMTMTILIIYFPSLVYTFHDKFYINGK